MSFNWKNLTKDDQWDTPPHVWQDVAEYIPKDKVVWEAFYSPTSTSPDTLRQLGCKEVISKDCDFLSSNHGEVVITNPPFSIKSLVLNRLYELDKPFMMVMPSFTLHHLVCHSLMRKHGHTQIIIPSKRIHYMKDGDVKKRTSFDSIYICYKMGLPEDLIFM